jgi:hypothetical protein
MVKPGGQRAARCLTNCLTTAANHAVTTGPGTDHMTPRQPNEPHLERPRLVLDTEEVRHGPAPRGLFTATPQPRGRGFLAAHYDAPLPPAETIRS